MAKFKVRARTVDMLGRQQIAGIPTAISELFKNAHDAYARNVEIDYFRQENLLVLRDDGLGMTPEDFEQRWLTIGTDSKVGGKGLKRPPKDPEQAERPILGEKGIGRLAIAVLGPQALIISRAKPLDLIQHNVVVAYLNWEVFELPGLDLEEVVIPIREISPGTLPNGEMINDMKNELIESLRKLGRKIDPIQLEFLELQIRNFDVDPLILGEELGSPSLLGENYGTHFYISPTDSLIADDIDSRADDRKATRFEKNLIGFTNTMTPGSKKPPILTKFRDYIDEGSPIERIGEKTFFVPDEFNEVDHRVIGTFDQFGQFQGEVGIYHSAPEPYVLNWDKGDGLPTACGPFSISFAYLQGVAKDSIVPPEEFLRLRRKLDRHGGLYIYKDGVRVQPYGDSDYDFLDIERRRNLGAGYYFYSYRRMFGVIELNSLNNSRLTEKAGREGFRENKAYRDFRSILINFFVQSAADFFREEGRYSDQWSEKRLELNRTESVRRKKASQALPKKNEFKAELESFFKGVDEALPEVKVNALVREAKQKIDSIVYGNQSSSFKAATLLKIEGEVLNSIRSAKQSFSILKPRGVGLSKDLNLEWQSYLEQSARLQKEVFSPAEDEVSKAVSGLAVRNDIPIELVSRVEIAVKDKAEEALKNIRKLKQECELFSLEVSRQVKADTSESMRAISHTVDDVFAKLSLVQRDSFEGGVTEIRRSLEDRISLVEEEHKNRLEKLREQLRTVILLKDKDSYDSAELAEALEEELDALRERRDADLELAQLGMALSTVTHEFEKTVGSLRDGFRRLKAWAAENPALNQLYYDMRASFDHLDGYLTLFTPLDRRLYRKPSNISGKDIYDFLVNLFEVRLGREKIRLFASDNFLVSSVQGFTSSFYPVFVNLIDNSIFWLAQIHDREKLISLDLGIDGVSWIVSDNGPGIGSKDKSNIFSLNFSRRPGGRGMGLFISREVLDKVGYNLVLEASVQGTTFSISPKSEI
ncbi:ATP-binding protein [Pseudomonas congelans]|uniref:ATP-binding protein n=1 Tax=Pseudomonas congelans TaxID=200452 RepID=UPI000BB64176|nr:ATP-binding protein [Pseudomonas congelans]PBQ01152.1 hypothetical protein CCL24_00140 [Pseudomonas congelans]